MTSRGQEQRESIRAGQRERILTAARTLFARRGLAATRISDIAAAAGISHGLVYHYFRSKDEIFAENLELALQGALWVTAQAREQPVSPLDRIAWMVDFMVRGAREFPEFYLIVIQANTLESVPEGVRELMDRYGEQAFRNVVELVEEAQAAGQVVDDDPANLASLLLACVQGLMIVSQLDDGETDGAPELDLLLRLIQT